MPKAKQRATPKAHKHKDMDKVKIKRVKHTKKKISTKEKILGGLGLGSTLLGGAGAISASSQPQTQFVRTTENEKSSSSSKIRSTLNKIFGIRTAQGAMTAEQEAARQMLATGQNPDGTTATQEQLANANEIYYGGYYNQLPNVGSNYTPEELQNIGAQGLAGAHVIRDGQGNFMGAVNRVGDTIVVTFSNGSTETFTIAQALERMGVAANDTAKNLLILSRDDGYLATIGVVAPTGGGIGGGGGTGGGTSTSTNTGNVSGYEIWLQNDGTRLVGTDQGMVVYNPSTGIFTVDGIEKTPEEIDQIMPGLSSQLVNPSTGHIMNPPSMPSNTAGSQNIVTFSGVTFTEVSNDGRTWREANIPGLGQVAYENGRIFNASGTDITDIFDNSQLAALNTFFLSDANRSTGGGGTGGAGGGSGATGSGVSATDVSNAISQNNTSYLNNLLRGTGMDINAQLASNPELNRQLFEYMAANNMLTGFANGTLGALILSSNPTVSTTITPGKYGQSWSTEGVTQAYNNALTTFNFSTTKNSSGQVVSYTFNINGSTRTFSPQELNSFLNTTWNGGQFMNLSLQDRQLFVAAIQARLTDSSIGVGIPNLPSPNTNDAQAIHFIDSNGNLINFQQGFSPTGMSFRTDAEWVQRMFPGSRIVDAGFPGGTTGSWNPVDSGDPRGYYQLVLPNGESLNIGLFLQGNLDQSNGKVIVTLTGEQAKYFTAPTNNFVASVIGNTATTTTTAQTSGQITTGSLPAGVIGTMYNQGLSAYHASASVKNWSLVSGQLPAGLSINSNTGFISGTPSQVGNYNFTIRATFSNNQTAEKAFAIAVTGTSSNITTPPTGVGNLNTWVSQTSASVKVGESKNINVHALDGDAVLVGSNKITVTSSNNAVVGVVVGSDSNNITITGRSVGSATVRVHPSGRTDTGGDKVIMVTVTAAGNITTTTTNDNNFYPTPISSGGDGGGDIVTTTILNNTTGGGLGGGSNYVNLPDTTSPQTITRASVGDVGDDEGVIEDGEGSGVNYVNSVNEVGDDEDVEGTEGGTTTINSVSNVGDDIDEEVEGTEESTVTTYNQNTTNNNSGNTGSNGSGSGYGSTTTGNSSTGGYNYVGSSGSGNYTGTNGVQTYQNAGSGGGLAYQQTVAGQNAGTVAQGGVLAIHTVVKGDTLWEISRQYYGDPTLWFKIQEANMDKVPNVRQMRIGILLVIPNLNGQGLLPQEKSSSVATYQNQGVSARGTYKVKQGDTLWKVAKQSYGDGNLWRNILEANPNSLSVPGNTKTLKVGYVLNIPSLEAAQNTQITPPTITTYEQQPEIIPAAAVNNQANTSNPNVNPLGSTSQQNVTSQPIIVPSVSEVGSDLEDSDEEVEATE